MCKWSNKIWGRRGRYRTIVGFTTTRAIPLMARCTRNTIM